MYIPVKKYTGMKCSRVLCELLLLVSVMLDLVIAVNKSLRLLQAAHLTIVQQRNVTEACIFDTICAFPP
jgi:hypothetical protein